MVWALAWEGAANREAMPSGSDAPPATAMPAAVVPATFRKARRETLLPGILPPPHSEIRDERLGRRANLQSLISNLSSLSRRLVQSSGSLCSRTRRIPVVG